MLIHKNDIEVITKFAGDNDARYVLNGVYIEADGTLVATDGHVLGVLKPRAAAETEFPVLKGMEAVNHEEPLKPCIIRTDGLIGLAKQIKAPKRFPILDHAQIDNVETNKNGTVAIRVTDLATQQVMNIKKIDGKFPQYQNVLASCEEPAFRTSFDAELLIRTMQAAVKHCGKGRAVVEFEFPKNGMGATKAMVANSDCQVLTMVIMPCRGKRDLDEYGVLPEAKPKKKKAA